MRAMVHLEDVSFDASLVCALVGGVPRSDNTRGTQVFLDLGYNTIGVITSASLIDVQAAIGGIAEAIRKAMDEFQSGLQEPVEEDYGTPEPVEAPRFPEPARPERSWGSARAAKTKPHVHDDEDEPGDEYLQ